MDKFALIFVFFLPGALSASVDLTDIWSSFKSLYSKSYSADEDRIRFSIFENNTRRIVHHNLEADFGLHTYMVAVNLFAANTPDKVNTWACTGIDDHLYQPDGSPPNTSLPKFIDYRTRGYVTEVKYQGDHCGNSYIFGAVGALESAWAISRHLSHSNMVTLSEQNILDCYAKDCKKNGAPIGVFKYIMKHGIDTQASYPYLGKVTECTKVNKTIGATMKHFIILNSAYAHTMDVVANRGPVVACVSATPEFDSYKKGIYKNTKCGGKLNHAVVIIGYGEEKGEKYWILKNAWSNHWGENGFMRLARGYNMCRILFSVVIPLV